jgi:hypothetical protein
MEFAEFIQRNEPVVDKRGELFIFCSGQGTGFPLAGVKRNAGGMQFHAKRAAITRALGRERGLGRAQ